MSTMRDKLVARSRKAEVIDGKDTSVRALDHFLDRFRVQVPSTALGDTMAEGSVSSGYQEAELSPMGARLMTRQALTFPTPKALQKYLRDHPKADKSKHQVDKGESKKEPEKEEVHKDEDHDEKPAKKDGPDFSPLSRKLADKVKDWGSKAVKVLADAPKEVHKFIEDDAHRRKTLMTAHKKVEHFFKLPDALIETAREEVHEFKDAGSALAKLAKGGKLSRHDRHALKTVGTHLAITAAATAFTATSFGAGAALFGKAMAKHVALKAVSGVLAKGHMLEELGHIGHGIQHVMDKFAAEQEAEPEPKEDKGGDPMSGFAKIVLGAVAKEMEGLDVKAIGEALDTFSGDGADIKPLKGKKKASLAGRLLVRQAGKKPEAALADAMIKAYKAEEMPMPPKNGDKAVKAMATDWAKAAVSVLVDRADTLTRSLPAKYPQGPFRVLEMDSHKDSYETDGVWSSIELNHPSSVVYSKKVQLNYDRMVEATTELVELDGLAVQAPEAKIQELLRSSTIRKAVEDAFDDIIAMFDEVHPLEMEDAVLELALDRTQRDADTDDESDVMPVYGKTKLWVSRTRCTFKPAGPLTFEVIFGFDVEAEVLWPRDSEYDRYM